VKKLLIISLLAAMACATATSPIPPDDVPMPAGTTAAEAAAAPQARLRS
jgi:hypothetical protein